MGNMTRRELLSRTGKLAVGATVAGLVPNTLLSGAAKPNIIFILIDDLRWDHLGCMGHPFLKTPGMDRLAGEGVHFTNAFCTTSLCSPSRASFLTGQYVHRHGVKDNLSAWDNEKNHTFFDNLKEAGYRNAFIGKWHMPGKIPKIDSLDRFITFDASGGQGYYYNCPLIIDGVRTERPGRYITTDLTDYAIQFIEEKSEKPFCLYLSHKAVHSPWRPPKDLDGIYQNEDLSFLPREYFSFISFLSGKIIEGAPPATTEYNYRNYCESLAAFDRELVRLLDELDKLGITHNTAVVLAGDNGYSWGEHMDVGKRDASEVNMRIPFIVRYPRGTVKPGRRPEGMALNIDLAPTLLDLAGAAPGKDCDGLSLKPVLENRKEKVRGSFLYEYFKDFPYNVPEQCGVRTERHIYITYRGRRKAGIFDVNKDPGYRKNLIGTPEGKRMLPEMKRLLAQYRGGADNGK
ncbi:MAG: sulfatase-like hydrolase/transferase [Spirochaetes bacterium]|jgi:N-acetylglucosamine-6-sulfatase|nr:sulfatase-like hydrolase/transferase [Spirochaetota bacterium]